MFVEKSFWLGLDDAGATTRLGSCVELYFVWMSCYKNLGLLIIMQSHTQDQDVSYIGSNSHAVTDNALSSLICFTLSYFCRHFPKKPYWIVFNMFCDFVVYQFSMDLIQSRLEEDSVSRSLQRESFQCSR
jgi:hypothetical protein